MQHVEEGDEVFAGDRPDGAPFAPAELRAAKILGGDAVGMSTVPEVILARYMGLEVAAVSTVTNPAAGLTDQELSHEEVKEAAPKGADKLRRMLPRVIAAYGASA